ncbi:MAG: FAD-dependent oxidoreductase [Actinomycetia bacterium]|nr:FAD-dependent oxidoreductase [Actinomycetes bacterium]
MKLILEKRMKNTDGVYSFIFSPQGSLTWQAGQYMQFILPHENPDSRGIKRFFSIASAPHEQVVMVTTRILEEEGSSFKRKLMQLKPQDSIQSAGPRGNFRLTEYRRKAVMIAGGIGITPFRSILLDLDYREKMGNIQLFYATQDKPPVFKDELDGLEGRRKSFKMNIIPDRIDSDNLKQGLKDFSEKQYFVSGPMGMVKGIEQQLRDQGIGNRNIKKDYFPGYD